MPTRQPSTRRSKSRVRRAPRKDRLIQTRVPEDLESTLKEEAARRRLTVSHLIRSILEDTFELVDDVVADLDKVVTDSVDLARNVGRNARRLASSSRRTATPAAAGDGELSHIYAWSEVVLHRPASCLRCGKKLARGDTAFAGLSETPRRRRAWVCRRCIEAL